MSAVGGITLDGAVLTTLGGIAGAAVTGFFAWLKMREKRSEKQDAHRAERDKRDSENDQEWSEIVRDFIDDTKARLVACESRLAACETDREELRARVTGQSNVIRGMTASSEEKDRRIGELETRVAMLENPGTT